MQPADVQNQLQQHVHFQKVIFLPTSSSNKYGANPFESSFVQSLHDVFHLLSKPLNVFPRFSPWCSKKHWPPYRSPFVSSQEAEKIAQLSRSHGPFRIPFALREARMDNTPAFLRCRFLVFFFWGGGLFGIII